MLKIIFRISRFYSLFFWISFHFLLGSNSYAEIQYTEMKGIHALLTSDYEFLSPIHGFIALKSRALPNLRFFGNYGPPIEGVACETRYRNTNDCPHDAPAAFLQRLFPSPDGANFVANQGTADDGASLLTPLSIGKILGRLSRGSSPHLREELTWIVYSTLFAPSLESLKLNRTDKAKKPDEAKEFTLLKAQLMESLKQWKGLREGVRRGDEDALLKTDILSGEISAAGAKMLAKCPSAFDEARKTKNWAKSESFATSIFNARRVPQDSHLYPPHFVERALLGYFWMKSNQKQDLLSLFHGMQSQNEQIFKPGLEQNFDLIRNAHYTFSDYLEFKQGFVKDLPTEEQIEELNKDIEKASFLAFSQLFEVKTPPLVSYASAAHKSLGVNTDAPQRKYHLYPDCGETSLRNFFNIMTYDPVNRVFDPQVLERIATDYKASLFSFPAKDGKLEKGLLAYYQRNSDMSSISSEKARDDWSRRVVSNLNNLKYYQNDRSSNLIEYYNPRNEDVEKRKARIEKFGGEAPVCEINSGLGNMLAVIEALLGDESEDPTSLGSLRKGQNAQNKLEIAAKKLDRIVTLFSRPGFQLDWRLKGTGEKVLPMDAGIEIEFLLGDKPLFTWTFQLGHFSVSTHDSTLSGWRNSINPHKVVPALQPWFVNENNMADLLSSEGAHPNLNLIWSLSVRENDTKLKVMRVLAKNAARSDRHSTPTLDAPLAGVIRKWIRTLPEADENAQIIILDFLFSYDLVTNDLHPQSAFQEAYNNSQKVLSKKDPQTLIYQAAKEDLFGLSQYLAINQIKTNTGLTIGPQLVMSGNVDVLASFIRKIPKLMMNMKERFGDPLALVAVFSKKEEILKLFAREFPALLMQRNELGETAMSVAAAKGDVCLVKAMAQDAPKTLDLIYNSGTLGHKINFSKHPEMLDFLLATAPHLLEFQDRKGKTAAHFAAEERDFETLKKLAKKAPSVLMLKDLTGNTSLDLVSDEKEKDELEKLLNPQSQP